MSLAITRQITQEDINLLLPKITAASPCEIPPWNSMEIHGIPWISMELPWSIHGVPWNAMEFYGVSMEFHGVSMEFHGMPCSSMKFHVMPWNSMGFLGVLMEFHEMLQSCMEFHGVSMKFDIH